MGDASGLDAGEDHLILRLGSGSVGLVTDIWRDFGGAIEEEWLYTISI